jgi:hypothetical protein
MKPSGHPVVTLTLSTKADFKANDLKRVKLAEEEKAELLRNANRAQRAAARRLQAMQAAGIVFHAAEAL